MWKLVRLDWHRQFTRESTDNLRPKPAQNKHNREHAREIKRFVPAPPFLLLLSLHFLFSACLFCSSTFSLGSWWFSRLPCCFLSFLFLLQNISTKFLTCPQLFKLYFFQKNILTVHMHLQCRKAKQHHTKATLSISYLIQTTLCLIPCVSESGGGEC